MKHQVHNLIILDESGSMESIKSFIIQGFNEIVQTVKGIQSQFPEQEHFISFVTFNGLGIRVHNMAESVDTLLEIESANYHPNGSTPLFDTIGFSTLKLKEFLQGKTGYNVLITILTDGEENASKEFNAINIKRHVEQLQNEGWVFTYIGADHDVYKAANMLSIKNTMAFSKDDKGIKKMFETEKSARVSYSKKIQDKESLDENYYGLKE